MTTQTRGRYRTARRPIPAATWLLATVGAFALFAVLALAATAAFAAPLTTGYVSAPHYQGWRFKSASPICIEDRTPTSTMQAAALDAARDFQRNTALWTVLRRGRGSCNGYEQRVIVMTRNAGASGWNGRVELAQCSSSRTRQCFEWGLTEHGGATWIVRDYAVVMLNTYYRNTLGGWDHVITHELGHAVGLAHRSDTCSSVMPDRACRWLSFLSGGPNGDVGIINRIYAQ